MSHKMFYGEFLSLATKVFMKVPDILSDFN